MTHSASDARHVIGEIPAGGGRHTRSGLAADRTKHEVLPFDRGGIAYGKRRALHALDGSPDIREQDALIAPAPIFLVRQKAPRYGTHRRLIVVDVRVEYGAMPTCDQRTIPLNVSEHDHLVGVRKLLDQRGHFRQIHLIDLLRIREVGHPCRMCQPYEPIGLETKPSAQWPRISDAHPVRDQPEGRLLALYVIDRTNRADRIDVVDHSFDGCVVGGRDLAHGGSGNT